MHKAIAGFVAGLIITTGVALADAPCLEDMPCWDCTTMGNGICGTEA